VLHICEIRYFAYDSFGTKDNTKSLKRYEVYIFVS